MQLHPTGVLLALALLLGPTRSVEVRAFRETFDGSALGPGWSVLHPSLAAVEVAGGALRITPSSAGPGSMWYQDSEGVLAYRMVTGDFTATARVHARDAGNGTQPPPAPYRLGGILARDPSSSPGQRNSVHVALGAGVVTDPVCAEDKTTEGSVSDFMLHPIASADGDLRLRRRGDQFECSFRALGSSTWTPLRTHVRPDLPSTLEIGLMAYSAQTPPAIAMRFESFFLGP